MNLATAVERANAETSPKRAAGLYHDISYELEGGAGGSEELYEAGEQALQVLEDKFPDVAQEAANITRPPNVSTRAKRQLDQDPDGARERVRERQRSAGSRRARGRGRAPSPGRALALADDASGGWLSELGDVFVGAMALSVGYLLLTRASAVGKLALGASNIARAVVSPAVDPLNPKGIA